MSDAPIYARQGEEITCSEGHRIGVFNCDVESRFPAKSNQIDWEIVPAPKAGEPISPCPCGAPYARFIKGLQVFIGGAWRTTPKGSVIHG